MEILTIVLFMGGKILYSVILTFLLAIPSGIGLGIGLHYAKKLLFWRSKKRSPEERADNYKDFLSDQELTAAASA